MARTDRLSTYRTTWISDERGVSVTYVNTEIVKAGHTAITLNSGGWQTVTTKRKMNQASNQFGLRFCVYQHKGEWFVDVRNPDYTPENDTPYWRGLNIPFRDGMVFDMYTGEVLA